MLIALLALLGVDLIVLLAFVGVVIGRHRWVSRQPDAFAAVAQVIAADWHQGGSRARHGYGRWVRDVFVWTPGPLCLGNTLIPIDWMTPAQPAVGRVRRLGPRPHIVTLVGVPARIELTVAHADIASVTAPFENALHPADQQAVT